MKKIDIYADNPTWPNPGPEIVDGRIVIRPSPVTSDDLRQQCLCSSRELYAYAHQNLIKPCVLLAGVEMVDETKITELVHDIQIKNHPACYYYCHNVEERGDTSVRQAKQAEWSNPWHGNSHIEIILSNECNSSCIYCEPMFSSAWDRDIETSKTPIPSVLETKRLPQKYANGELILDSKVAGPREKEAAIRIIKELGEDYQKTACIAITGGEPMLNIIEEDHLGLVLRTFYAANRQWARRIRYDLNTSLNVSEERCREVIRYLNEYVEQYPYLDLVVLPSIDSLYDNYNYVRYGSNFAQFEKNLDILLTESNFTVEMQSAIHPVTMIQLSEFFEYMNNKAKTIREFSITPIIMPEYLKILDRSFTHQLDAAISYLETATIYLQNIGTNKSALRTVMQMLKTNLPSVSSIKDAKELYDWFKSERGVDLELVNPVLHDYLTKMSLN